MNLSFTEKKNIRKNFGKLKETLSIPNLIEVQKNSYNEFLNRDGPKKKDSILKGLDRVFNKHISYRRFSRKSDIRICFLSIRKTKIWCRRMYSERFNLFIISKTYFKTSSLRYWSRK